MSLNFDDTVRLWSKKRVHTSCKKRETIRDGRSSASCLANSQALVEKLELTRPAIKERVVLSLQREQMARTPELFCQKQKEESHQSRLQDCEMGKS